MKQNLLFSQARFTAEESSSCFLCCQTSTSAVLQLEAVTSMPTVRILLVLIFVRAKLDTVEMEKHAQVDKHTILLDNEVPDYNVNSSVLQRPLWPIGQSLLTPRDQIFELKHWNFLTFVDTIILFKLQGNPKTYKRTDT